MKQYVTDTQCLLWHLSEDRRLPRSARRILDAAEDGRAQVIVPSIVLVEAVFLLQRQKVKEDVLTKLFELSEQPDANFYVTPLDLAVVQALRSFGPAAVPELSDRIVAATALALGLPLLTTDSAMIDSGLIETVD